MAGGKTKPDRSSFCMKELPSSYTGGTTVLAKSRFHTPLFGINRLRSDTMLHFCAASHVWEHLRNDCATQTVQRLKKEAVAGPVVRCDGSVSSFWAALLPSPRNRRPASSYFMMSTTTTADPPRIRIATSTKCEAESRAHLHQVSERISHHF